MNHNLKLIKYTIFSSALVVVEGNYDLEAPSLNLHHAVWRILNLENSTWVSLFIFHRLRLRMDQVGLIYMLVHHSTIPLPGMRSGTQKSLITLLAIYLP